MATATIAIIFVIVLGCFIIIAVVWLIYKWRQVRHLKKQRQRGHSGVSKHIRHHGKAISPPPSMASVPEGFKSPLPPLQSFSSLSMPWKRSRSLSPRRSSSQSPGMASNLVDLETGLLPGMSQRRFSDIDIKGIFYPSPSSQTSIVSVPQWSASMKGFGRPEVGVSTGIPPRKPVPTYTTRATPSDEPEYVRTRSSIPVIKRKPLPVPPHHSSPPKILITKASTISSEQTFAKPNKKSTEKFSVPFESEEYDNHNKRSSSNVTSTVVTPYRSTASLPQNVPSNGPLSVAEIVSPLRLNPVRPSTAPELGDETKEASLRLSRQLRIPELAEQSTMSSSSIKVEVEGSRKASRRSLIRSSTADQLPSLQKTRGDGVALSRYHVPPLMDLPPSPPTPQLGDSTPTRDRISDPVSESAESGRLEDEFMGLSSKGSPAISECSESR